MTKEISLYFHIPFCLSKCDYCDFFSIKCKAPVADEYVDALCTELSYKMQKLLQEDEIKVSTIYIGGGTPSLLSKEQLKKISSKIFSYDVKSDYEFTVEVNPDDVSVELLAALEQCGVNRISCGVQSFSESVLKSVHRRADYNQVIAALDCLTAYWNKKISIDLICGLPGESRESMLQGLEKLTSLKNKEGKAIGHISFYSLSLEENTPLYERISSGQTPYDYDFSDSLWLAGRDFLLSKGYCQYEVSNFCLNDNECRHNMVYWHSGDYLGIGSGATGTLHNPDASAVRTTGCKDIDSYIKNPCLNQTVEIISPQTARFEFFMMGLRTSKGIDRLHFKRIFGEDFPEKTQKVIEQWCERGLMTEKSDGKSHNYSLTQQGLLFLNTFLEQII